MSKVAELLLKKKLALAAANLSAGEMYRAKNAENPAVVTLDSGVQYEVVETGVQKLPEKFTTVYCNYHGTNLKGEVFDSSVERGKPATFRLERLIKGWQEIVPLMKVGSKWKVTVPHTMAYREEQLNKFIGPNSTLIFEIELLGVS